MVVVESGSGGLAASIRARKVVDFYFIFDITDCLGCFC